MILGHRIVAIVLFALSCMWIYLSINLPFPAFARVAKMGPGHYPSGVAVLLAILSVLLFAQTFRRQKAERPADEEETQATDARPLYIGTFLFLLYVAALPFIGFFVSSALFVFFFIRILGRYGWVLTASLAVLIPGLLWVLFARLLTVPLPKGPWGF